MQRGGISKASRGVNLSEDIFAGYNNELRGGAVHYVDYMVVRSQSVVMRVIIKLGTCP